MRGARQGNAVEVRIAKQLEAEGWIVGSRRHMGGAGDLLAVRRGSMPRLIEVKATSRPPWHSTWGPSERRALTETASMVGAMPVLAWWPPRGQLRWIPRLEWPS